MQPAYINCQADPVTDHVTITPSGEGLTFSPESISFSGCSSGTFEVTPSVVGTIPIHYKLSGDYRNVVLFTPSNMIDNLVVRKRT
jgi:hypothetical protein